MKKRKESIIEELEKLATMPERTRKEKLVIGEAIKYVKGYLLERELKLRGKGLRVKLPCKVGDYIDCGFGAREVKRICIGRHNNITYDLGDCVLHSRDIRIKKIIPQSEYIKDGESK